MLCIDVFFLKDLSAFLATFTINLNPCLSDFIVISGLLNCYLFLLYLNANILAMSNKIVASGGGCRTATATTGGTERLRKTKSGGVATKLPHQVLRRNERERKRVQQVF